MNTEKKKQKIENEPALNTLSNTDHQKVVATINWLNNCRSKNEFNQVLKEALLPLMNSDSVYYGWFPDNQKGLKLLGGINTPNNCRHSWEQIINSKIQHPITTHSYIKTPNILLRTFSDDKNPYNSDINQQPQEHFNPSKLKTHKCCTILALRGEQNPLYQFHFCRQLNDKKKIFNQRDINLLNILKSPLLQTLALILFQEKRPYSRQIMDFWSEQTEPIAVVNNKGCLLFHNSAFEQTIKQQEQSFSSITSTLINSLQRKHTKGNSFLSKLGKRLYEIKLTLISYNTNDQYSVYLIQLSRVTHTTGKIFNQLSRKDLTHREIEIALLIYQGITTREIAEIIHLSYHTVRNHIKNIYNKLEVSSRVEMLAWAG